MPEKLKPSPHQVVIRLESPRAAAGARQALAVLGEISALPGHPDCLLLNTSRKASSKPFLRALRGLLGDKAQVMPVLLDEDEQPHYALGGITIRFKAPPKAKELADLKSKYGLLLQERNEFVPEQASFTLAEPSQAYLPDLLKQLVGRKELEAAWPETVSAYHRG